MINWDWTLPKYWPRVLLAALIAALVIACTACNPKPLPNPIPNPVPQPPPSSEPSIDRDAIIGDSLMVQGSFFGGICEYGNIDDACRHTADMTGLVGLGWEAEDALPGLRAAVAIPGRNPERLRIALGQNEAVGGLTQTDKNQLFQLIMTPGSQTCIALILPYYNGTNTQRRTGIRDYRTWAFHVYDIQGQLDRQIVLVDWGAYVRPEYLAPDFFHLNTSNVLGPQAYADMAVSRAEEECDEV